MNAELRLNEDVVLRGFLRFGEHLRRAGLPVTPPRMIDLIQLLPDFDLTSPDDLYWGARCLVVERADDLAVFDEAFASFWRPQPSAGAPEAPPHALPRVVSAPPTDGDGQPLGKPEPGEPRNRRYGKPLRTPIEETEAGEGEGGGILSYSPAEALRRKDFALFTPDEVVAARRLLVTMRLDVAHRRSRRLVPAADGRYTDWRRTFRRNLKYGGTLIELARFRPKTVRRPVVLICDVSGSMDRYTRLLLHFVHTVACAAGGRLEAFVFGTRLTRITRPLEARDVDRALLKVSDSVADWSGGTRIGDAMVSFNRLYGRRVLGRGAVVVVLSDGWDKGDPQVLQQEVARLQRRSHRLIWVNPSLGLQCDRPMAVGMRAVLPFVDDFLPASNLESLSELGRILSSLRPGRPARRQRTAAV